MKNVKKMVKTIGMTTAILLSTGMVAFAATYEKPAQIVSNLTGKSAEEVYNQKVEENKTYGQIAEEAGVLEEFKAQNLQNKINIINDRVSSGELTQEEADKIIEELKVNMENCDQNGSGMRGNYFGQGNENCGLKDGSQMRGNGNGLGNGQGRGLGNGQGNGQGRGNGMGRGLRR